MTQTPISSLKQKKLPQLQEDKEEREKEEDFDRLQKSNRNKNVLHAEVFFDYIILFPQLEMITGFT